jgi:drug/metabolite transporter (DMT)-like permease
MPALGYAVATGMFVALYTTYDAWGIRSTADPFTFLAWFFMLDGIFIPVVTRKHWRGLPAAEILPLLKRGVFGAIVALFSFGSIMLATRLDRVGEAAVLRETSTVFAALIGWVVLGEKAGWVRVGLLALIAGGALVMKWVG